PERAAPACSPFSSSRDSSDRGMTESGHCGFIHQRPSFDYAALHYGQKVSAVLQHGYVRHGVALDHQQVGQLADLHCAKLVRSAHNLGPRAGGAAYYFQSTQANVADKEGEFASVVAVRIPS